MQGEKAELYDHDDALDGLGSAGNLNAKLNAVHRRIRQEFPFIGRVAVALYDDKSGLLKTFLASSDGANNPLVHYETALRDAPLLDEILERKRPRVVNDLGLLDAGEHLHTKRIREEGFRASYTVPMRSRGRAIGFLFFNATRTGCFTPDVLDRIDVHAHLIMEIVAAALTQAQTTMAALRSASRMVHTHDPETGNHLERMARFARVIAQELCNAGALALDDEQIERIFLYAPLHDVGKIAIPDSILAKPGKLTPDEFEVMKTHTTRGRQIIDSLIGAFELEDLASVGMLRAIAEDHHETLDGQGYPNGLRGDAIPFEARIIAVADIFDALTSHRAYKPAWSNDDAIETLERMAETKLDRDCVSALVRRRSDVEEIQRMFRDEEHDAAFAH